MPWGTQELILIEQRLTNEGYKIGVAYLLLFFLFFVSAHRFYLRRPGTAILQILLILCFGIGLVWVLIDLFLIPDMARSQNAKLRDDLTRQVIGLTPRR